MNSIDIAKKLVEENNSDIEDSRRAEKIILQRIAQYEKDIEKYEKYEKYEKFIKIKKRALAAAKTDLQRKRDQRKERHLDNVALRMFIADCDGLDTLD